MNRPHRRRHAAGPSLLLFDAKGTYGRLLTVSAAAADSGDSPPSPSVTRAAVTTFVVAPTMACALSEPCALMKSPDAATNRASRHDRGTALASISAPRSGVISGVSKYRNTLLKHGAPPT